LIPAPPQCPEYGDSGDLIGARRMRRAFRWGVALVTAFTILLWVVEQFGRYERAERLYLSALTQKEKGRIFLREAVKIDQANEVPSARYLEALAEREESDLVVSAYERAYQIDPENADLALKYGCQLIELGLYPRARQLFRHAAEGGSHNALAVYLEAAVLPLMDPPDYDSALALMERANASEDNVTFPLPMWSPVLKRDGHQFADLRRQMVHHCGQPIEQLAKRMLEATEIDLNEGRADIALARLDALQSAGRRIAAGAAPTDVARDGLGGGAPQLYLGLRTASLAVEARKKIATATAGAPDEQLVSLGTRLDAAMREIEEFENNRKLTIVDEQTKYGVPLLLVRDGLVIIFACFLVAYAASKALTTGGYAHNVRHSRMSLIALAASTLGLFTVLTIIGLVQRASQGSLPAETLFRTLWWVSIAGGFAVGLISPALALPGCETLLTRLPPELRGDTSVLRKKRRAAYLSLVKRYFGLQFGLALCAVCTWVIAYRVLTSTYPWMTRLLVSGMESQEVDIIRSILASLG